MTEDGVKLSLNERGVAGIYLLAMKLPADQRALDALSDIIRLCFLSGVSAGLKHPDGDPLPINDEMAQLTERLQKTCYPRHNSD